MVEERENDGPTLVISGDEDWPGLLPAFMKHSIPSAPLSIIPNAGHAIKHRGAGEYNRIVGAFFFAGGQRPLAAEKIPEAIARSIKGMSRDDDIGARHDGLSANSVAAS